MRRAPASHRGRWAVGRGETVGERAGAIRPGRRPGPRPDVARGARPGLPPHRAPGDGRPRRARSGARRRRSSTASCASSTRHVRGRLGRRAARGARRPGAARHVALTFDDGYRDNYERRLPRAARPRAARGVLPRHRVPRPPARGVVGRDRLDGARRSPRDELEPGDWLDRAAARCAGAGQRRGGPARSAAYVRLHDARTDAVPRVARPRASGSGRADPARGGLDVDDLGHGPGDAARRDGVRRAHGRPSRARALPGRAPAPRDRRLGGPDPRRAGRGADAVQLSRRRGRTAFDGRTRACRARGGHHACVLVLRRATSARAASTPRHPAARS